MAWSSRKLGALFHSLQLAEKSKKGINQEKEHDSSTYYKAVLEKLIKMAPSSKPSDESSQPDEDQCGAEGATAIAEDEKVKMAKIFSDRELLWQHFFSGIHHDVVQVVEETLEESDANLGGTEEKKHGRHRAEDRSMRVSCLPMKLLLTPLKRGGAPAKTAASFLDMKFGPLHVALQVGQVVLEWDDSSLVTPYHCDHNDRLVQVSVETHSQWVKEVTDKQDAMAKAVEDLQCRDQVGLYYLMLSKKIEMVHSLIEVIIKYNRYKHYNVITCNCQHFVTDALTALRVFLPKQLTGGLGDYYRDLTAGRTPSIPEEFATHRSLDEYVEKSNLKEMSQGDLEFILAMYYRFHLELKERLRKENRLRDSWKCNEATCRMSLVERLLNTKTLLIYRLQAL